MNLLHKTAYAVMLSAVTLTSVTTFSQAHAAPATQQQATSSLIKQLSGIQNITANFEQTTKLTNASTTPRANTGKPMPQHMNQSFSGVMKVARPGKFYWETIKPAKQLIVTTGKSVWIYDPDLEQAVKQSLDEQVANTPALLLSGNAQEIMNAYDVSQPDATKTYYSLKPKNTEGAFERLLISFGKNNAPTLMILEDSMGQTTTIKFNTVKVNTKFDQNAFNFSPPKGTDIIEQ